MIVTDKEFFMEKKLVSKLDLMIDRLRGTDDSILLISGDEGIGKTNFAAGACYYISHKTGRNYTPKHIFFDLDKLIDFASKTKEQIIHWDEGALGGLATEWWSKNQQKFMRLLMVARKKKHFMVICIPKFYKLNEYIVVERSIGLVHCYARQNIQKGRFFYYTKAKKETLYTDWKRSRKRNYKRNASFGGSFLEYMPKVFSEEEVQEYENMKDKAILNINEYGKKRMSKLAQKDMKMKYRLYLYAKQKDSKITQTELAKILGITRPTLSDWRELPEKYPFLKDVKL